MNSSLRDGAERPLTSSYTATRNLVGSFVADDEDDIALVMDECTDATGCEYVELPAGGVMWKSRPSQCPILATSRSKRSNLPAQQRGLGAGSACAIKEWCHACFFTFQICLVAENSSQN
ncbi:hypothetical protein EDE08_10447 [Bradyrhizobium sp. R2.2-H]|jgi:hypothetical protein|uniref:hypothetical protein n=1 Tax=unclassified Bradyrhizobium TaxID=2631580 RepID=UPI0010449C07|nr:MULTISPECIES: hypothetical protein [unclassified Bradyrhizobium]TCU73925.1 hypothetical protein EDE10_104595 [Bradyrhizobium sp. Y-H1]TCU75885.1 hypothetical protein EDE08_10447 [Bradyrhizobium sp. R2.2-H]